jgi:hypothetical protein
MFNLLSRAFRSTPTRFRFLLFFVPFAFYLTFIGCFVHSSAKLVFRFCACVALIFAPCLRGNIWRAAPGRSTYPTCDTIYSSSCCSTYTQMKSQLPQRLPWSCFRYQGPKHGMCTFWPYVFCGTTTHFYTLYRNLLYRPQTDLELSG